MKRSSLYVGLLALALGAASCKTTQKQEALTADELAGKWTISAIAGEPVQAENALTLDFTQEGRVHGEVGCNIYNNTYTFDAAASTLTFSPDGQMTMMMCPDAETEGKIVAALAGTAGVARSSEQAGCIDLLGASGDILLTLCK